MGKIACGISFCFLFLTLYWRSHTIYVWITLEILNPQTSECQDSTLGNTVLPACFIVMSWISRATQTFQTHLNDPSSFTCFTLLIKTPWNNWKSNHFRFLLAEKFKFPCLNLAKVRKSILVFKEAFGSLCNGSSYIMQKINFSSSQKCNLLLSLTSFGYKICLQHLHSNCAALC